MIQWDHSGDELGLGEQGNSIPSGLPPKFWQMGGASTHLAQAWVCLVTMAIFKGGSRLRWKGISSCSGSYKS